MLNIVNSSVGSYEACLKHCNQATANPGAAPLTAYCTLLLHLQGCNSAVCPHHCDHKVWPILHHLRHAANFYPYTSLNANRCDCTHYCSAGYMALVFAPGLLLASRMYSLDKPHPHNQPLYCVHNCCSAGYMALVCAPGYLLASRMYSLYKPRPHYKPL